MKKFLISLFFSLFLIFLVITPLNAENSAKKYNFSYNSQFLSNELFPKIRSTIDDFDFQDKSKENAQKLINIINKSVEDCLSNSKISIIRPYKVYLLKFSNNIRSVYVIQVDVALLDNEETKPGVFLVATPISKRFIVDIVENSKPKMEI